MAYDPEEHPEYEEVTDMRYTDFCVGCQEEKADAAPRGLAKLTLCDWCFDHWRDEAADAEQERHEKAERERP